MEGRIKIFLASSEELRQERLELADFVENLNRSLERTGICLQLVKWEYLDSSMGPSHKQEEYNEALKECELCIVIYWSRFGIYTKTELDTAYERLKAGNNPRKMYVYFKEEDEAHPISAELKEFRDSFPLEYGHFESRFSNIDTLKSQFLLQFIDYQGDALKASHLFAVKDAKIIFDGKTYVDLMNVPFVGNNEEYALLLKNIKKTKKLLDITEPDDEEYTEYAEELRALETKKEKMESGLWNTALEITRLSNEKCSDRLRRAIDLFNKGDNKGAGAILEEEAIYKDAETNINLIEIGRQGVEGLKTNIEELKLKNRTLENEMAEGWTDKMTANLKKISHYTRVLYGEESIEYVRSLLDEVKKNQELGVFKYETLRKASDIAREIFPREKGSWYDHPVVNECEALFVDYYMSTGRFEEAQYSNWSVYGTLNHYNGRYHPTTVLARRKGAIIDHYLGEPIDVLDGLLFSLKHIKKAFGEKHQETMTSYHQLGHIYRYQYDRERALKYLDKALQLQTEINGEKHGLTGGLHDDIARVLIEMGDLSAAEDHAEKGLEIRKRYYGLRHISVSRSLLTLSLLKIEKGDIATAKELNEKASEISIKFWAEKCANFSLSEELDYRYNNVLIHYHEGNKEKALEEAEASRQLIHNQNNITFSDHIHNHPMCRKFEELANRIREEILPIRR